MLPAGGAVLCWVLVLTLWLPLLDYARSYAPMMREITRTVQSPECVEVLGLSRAQIAALQFHGQLTLRAATHDAVCPVLLVNDEASAKQGLTVDATQWAISARRRDPR